MKKIIIIGATSGIGYEVAKICAQAGWTVGAAGRRTDKLQALQAGTKGHVEIQQLDITREEAPCQLHELIGRLGGMDIFLHCSGIGSQNPELDPAIELAAVETNAAGFTRMVTAAWNYFKEHPEGHIAVISSIAGTKGLGMAPSYSATKRFQNTYIDALAQLARLQKLPVAFTDIRPGFVRTDLLKDRRYPLLMEPEPVARQIVEALRKKKRRAIIDWRYRILVFIWKLIPSCLWERLPVRN